MRFAALVVACLLFLANVAGGPVAVTAAATDEGTVGAPDELGVEYVVSRTPVDPGHVDVTVRFHLPESVDELTTRPAVDTTVESTEGFEGDGTLRWDGTTRTPSFTFRKPVDVSVERQTREGPREGFLYTDVGEWALVRAPSVSFRYGASESVTVNRTLTVDGPGVAGQSMVFLGEHTVHERTVGDQRLRLVVPRAANLTESPTAILDTVGRAAEGLSFGDRDPTVTMVAAPTDGVTWGSTGLQRGQADFWVRDVQAVGTAENVWVHEYVHTRQDYRPTSETAWTGEAAADYYAALFAYEAESLTYEEFRVHLRGGRAARFEDAVMVDPSTWRGTLANYVKGALVLGALDRQLRLETDGRTTLQDVFETADRGERFGEAAFLSAVESAAGDETRAFAARYTRTTAAPAVWNRSEHSEAFGATATFRYAFRGSFGVTGPYRTVRLEGPVVPNETVRVRAEVTNVGDTNGTFAGTLYADGEAIETRDGSLAPGATRRLTLRVPVEAVPDDGRLTLRLGHATRTLVVEPPASPRLTNLSVPDRVRPNESFVARATLRNGAERPGKRQVTVRVDGEAVAATTVRLAPGEMATVDQRLTLPAGDHEVTVGERTATVRAGAGTPEPTAPARSVLTPSETDTPTRTPTSADGDGFGAMVTLAALALLGLQTRRV